jgi:hypothetical protein
MNVEVFNAGVPAYGPGQQLRLLPELQQRLRPHAIVAVFFENDVGDTALPYHQKYPFRVYRPFYSERGEVLLNEQIPQRPSLFMKSRFAGELRLWQAMDLFYYFVQDIQYAKYDIPNPRTATYPLRAYDGFVWDEDLKKRYPYVERTLIAIYERMYGAAIAEGATFRVISATERVNYAVEPLMRARGLPFTPGPAADKRYRKWSRVPRDDDHGNFLWAWILATEVFVALESSTTSLDFRSMPQLGNLPFELDLGVDAALRYLSGDWGEPSGGGRLLSEGGSVILAAPRSPPAEVMIEVSGRSSGARTLEIRDVNEKVVCRIRMSAVNHRYRCRLRRVEEPMLLLVFSVFDGSADPVSARRPERENSEPVVLQRVAVSSAS